MFKNLKINARWKISGKQLRSDCMIYEAENEEMEARGK
jgi:hypothetical protein